MYHHQDWTFAASTFGAFPSSNFVATFLKLWIVALFIGYAVWMRFTSYYMILIYSYDSLIDSSFLNILLAKHF